MNKPQNKRIEAAEAKRLATGRWSDILIVVTSVDPIKLNGQSPKLSEMPVEQTDSWQPKILMKPEGCFVGIATMVIPSPKRVTGCQPSNGSMIALSRKH